MNNPWERLNNESPFVLESDKQIIDEHNNDIKTKEDHKIHTELYPEPFLGNPNANVVLLNLNPGFSIDDNRFHKSNEYFTEQARKNLSHKADYGFYLLDPEINSSPGYKWWSSKLRILIQECGQEQVARSLLCIEFFPYHSVKFKEIALLKSQEYGFSLVKKAIERNAIIIIMRGKKLWLKAVPEIKEKGQYYFLNSPQNVCVTQNNLLKGVFNIIIKKIKNGYQSGQTNT